MAWDTETPAWERDDPLKHFYAGVQAGQAAALAPLRIQQARNDVTAQVLGIAHQGLQNQATAMKLDFDAKTMPFQVQELQSQSALADMKLGQERNEQASWERDQGTLRSWMEMPWEQRVKSPIPAVTSTKALKVVMDQERMDATGALAKERLQSQIMQQKQAARDLSERNRFMSEMAHAGLDRDGTTALAMTFQDGMPTEASWSTLSELKAAKEKAKAEAAAQEAEKKRTERDASIEKRMGERQTFTQKQTMQREINALRTKAAAAADPVLKAALLRQARELQTEVMKLQKSATTQSGDQSDATDTETEAARTPVVKPSEGRKLRYDPATGQLQGSGS